MEVTCSKCMARAKKSGDSTVRPGVVDIPAGSVDLRVRCPVCYRCWRASDPSVMHVAVGHISYGVRAMLFREVMITSLLIYVMLSIIGGCWRIMTAGIADLPP